MPGWEETKQAAQSAYLNAGNIYQDVHSSIGNAYQQILISGHLYPTANQHELNHQIAEDAYQPTAADWKEYEQWKDQTTPEPDDLFYFNHFPDRGQDLEPEM